MTSSTTTTTNSSVSTNGTASTIVTSTATITTNSTANSTAISSTVNATTVATAAAAATSVTFPLGDFLGIVIYCASTVALLCLLVVLVAALYGAFSSRHAANSYLGTKEEAARLLKSDRISNKKNRYENEYQPLRQSYSDTESMTDEDAAENHVMYFDKKGDLISLVNPNYGRPSPIMIDCQPDDDENIHYYMSIYKELATQAMTEPSDSWVLPPSNVMQVSTQEVTLKEPECDDN
ncbi:Ba160 [Baboon cytomegalovirus]|nr:Ba160 [Baboon cytomegalovirus]